jgi:hypothetical protein
VLFRTQVRISISKQSGQYHQNIYTCHTMFLARDMVMMLGLSTYAQMQDAGDRNAQWVQGLAIGRSHNSCLDFHLVTANPCLHLTVVDAIGYVYWWMEIRLFEGHMIKSLKTWRPRMPKQCHCRSWTWLECYEHSALVQKGCHLLHLVAKIQEEFKLGPWPTQPFGEPAGDTQS